MEAKYMNLHLYSDISPFEVIRWVSEKTVEIRPMLSTLNPNWKPEIIPGGFAGHCVNQNKQDYEYESNPEARTIRARLTKRGWKSELGFHKPSDRPRKFYDYNF